MKMLLKLWILFGLASFVNPLFAWEAPENLQVLEASDSSISLDWDDVENALGYYLYYGTKTASGSSYEVEGIDLIDESTYVLEGLDADTRYYIAFTSVDDFGTESEYSEELEYMTLIQGEESQAVSFRISEVEVIDESSVELLFSTDLETGVSATRDFIIEDKNTWVEVPVDISDVLDGEPRKVIVVLGTELVVNTEYKVTVLDISDAGGNSIESWIDAFINFTTPSEFTPELESAGPETEEETTEVVEEPVVVEEEVPEVKDEPTQPAPLWNNAGTTISTAENTLSTAVENEKLPQTGPEHWILGFIAFMLAGGLYYISRKKS